MIQDCSNGLGFSLKPPAWLRKAVKDLAGGKSANVPVPGGSTVTVTPAQPAPASLPDQVAAGVENIPGGWLTIAGGAAVLFFLLSKRRR